MGSINLHECGELIAFGLVEGEDVLSLILDRKVALMMASALTGPPTLEEGLALITSHLAGCGDLAEQSQFRIGQVLAHFIGRAAALGLTHWDAALDDIVCSKFIHSVTTEAKQPSVALEHLRRSSLRVGFRAGRQLAFWSGDPTLNIDLAPRSTLNMRPAAFEEIALIHMAAGMDDYWYTRQPTVIALLEAGCWSSECPAIGINALDDPTNPSRVRAPGMSRIDPRWCTLTDWGRRIIKARVRLLRQAGANGNALLVYDGTKDMASSSPQASICTAARTVIKRAGLGREKDLRPHSLVAAAGRSVFERTGDIEEVGRTLGLRSLDRAARVIQRDWKESP